MKKLLILTLSVSAIGYSALIQAHDGHALSETILHEAEHGLWLLTGTLALAGLVVILRKHFDSQ